MVGVELAVSSNRLYQVARLYDSNILTTATDYVTVQVLNTASVFLCRAAMVFGQCDSYGHYLNAWRNTVGQSAMQNYDMQQPVSKFLSIVALQTHDLSRFVTIGQPRSSYSRNPEYTGYV